MPEKETLQKTRKVKREGQAPSTQAGPFVEEEIDHVRDGKHGARSTKQAIAIGLSKARRVGVRLPNRKASNNRKRDTRTSLRRARATRNALKREGRSAASKTALSQQGRKAARSRIGHGRRRGRRGRARGGKPLIQRRVAMRAP